MRELSIFNRQRSKAYLFYVFCIFFVIFISCCGGGSDDSFSSGPSETGSAVFTVAWHDTPVILASENSLIAAQTEPVDCERINNVICEVSDESDLLLTSASFACSDHQGTIDNILAGRNRKFVILGEDVEGAILYRGEVSNITITAGHTTNVGTIDTYFFVPTGVSATAISSSQINLSWNATGNIGVTGYNIYRDELFLKSVTSTSTSDTGLSPLTQYCYTVSAYDAAENESGQSSPLACETTHLSDDLEAPTIPTGLSATSVSSSQINLSWNVSTDDFGVTGYNIYRDELFLKSVTSTSTSDTGLSPSTLYCYSVSAYDAAGNESDLSDGTCQATDPDIPPSTPTGLSATVVSTSQINLSWNASTDDFGVTGYNIYRDELFLKSVTSTSTSDTGLSPSTQYCYTISAYDAAGNESGQIDPHACETTPLANDIEAPTTPTGLSAIVVSMSQIDLFWNVSTDDIGVTGYNIYRDEELLKSVTSTWTSDTGLSPSNLYCYTISAYDAAGNESGLGDGACETTNPDLPPSTPTGLSATAVSSSQINLSWNVSTDDIGVTGYNIYREGEFLKSVISTWTSDTGLSPSTLYCYTVSAYDAAGNESDLSDVACEATNPDLPPSTPTGLSSTVVSTSQIDLSWNVSTDDIGVTGYDIYRDELFLKSVTSTWTSDTGLSPSTLYCYTVSAYDAAGNESGQSSESCAITDTPPDIFPPTPAPMTWETPPYATSNSSITMVATTASDPSTPITYTFDFVNSPTGGSGGTDSNWQGSTTYSNLLLGTNQQYGYRVQARDSEGNTTGYSSTSYAYTLANMPGYPSEGPFTNVTYNSIRVTWAANGNPPWTEYYCENIDNETNSGWTTNTYWDSVDLTCGTSYNFRVMARNGDGIITSWRDLDNQFTQECAGFDFDSTNEGWRMVGLYDDGGLEAIPDYFSDEPAIHLPLEAPNGGSIALGSDGFKFPSSPTGNTFVHWDLNSPNLRNNPQWQDMISLSYRITGEYIATSGKTIHVETVFHVIKPDATESYFSDFIFHEIPTESNGFWQTHRVDVLSLEMPPGTTILNINFRIFFEANSDHGGFVLVDHVVPTN